MRAVLAAVLLLLPLAASARTPKAPKAEPKLPPLEVTYAVTWNGIGLGDSTISLKPMDPPDCYSYDNRSNPSGLVRMLYGKPRETSQFCVRGGTVVPKHFQFENSRGDKNFTLDFDPAAKTVTDQKGAVRELPAGAQDRFGIQQAVRLWVISRNGEPDPAKTVEFAMVDQNRIRVYRFAITGKDSIEVPAGTFDTVVVERVDDPNKSLRLWLSPEQSYMPVKVEQIRNGKVDLRMELR